MLPSSLISSLHNSRKQRRKPPVPRFLFAVTPPDPETASPAPTETSFSEVNPNFNTPATANGSSASIPPFAPSPTQRWGGASPPPSPPAEVRANGLEPTQPKSRTLGSAEVLSPQPVHRQRARLDELVVDQQVTANDDDDEA